jgi:hypothetical protein
MKINQDVFPALIVLASADTDTPAEDLVATSIPKGDGYRQINTARVIISNDRIAIFQDSSNGPLQIFNEAIDPITHYKNPDRSKDSYVTTVRGKKIAFRKDNACGCGSRLKSLNAVKYISSSKDPE